MSELDFRRIVEDGPDAVGVLDHQQRYVFANLALARLTQVSPARLLGAVSRELVPAEHGAVWQQAVEDTFGSGRARELSFALETQEGPRRLACSLTKLPGPHVCAVWRDVTDAQRSSAAARYLAAVGAQLERFDPATSLQAIVDLAVPAVADWCFIHLAGSPHPRMVAIANADPSLAAAALERTSEPRPPTPDTPVARVLSGGPRELVDVDAELLARAARDPEQLERLKAQGFRSAVIAPLPGREGVLGAVTFAMSSSGRRYAERTSTCSRSWRAAPASRWTTRGCWPPSSKLASTQRRRETGRGGCRSSPRRSPAPSTRPKSWS